MVYHGNHGWNLISLGACIQCLNKSKRFYKHVKMIEPLFLKNLFKLRTSLNSRTKNIGKYF